MSKKDDALKLAMDWYDSGNENPDDFANMIKQVIALAQQPAQGCDYCNHPQYVGTKCKNCGREQPAQQQEPAAVARVDDLERGGRVRALAMGLGLDAPLYTTPPQRKPLTDEQIGMAFRKAFPVGGVVFTNGAIDFARNIEAAHGIKGDE